ncbi:hypothetical protein JAAARDRAFT_150588 [Jaapia argillacea MUCL 33604]|uniref:Ubiquinone biosynthesis O-methyltransferase, mitochondrial n=1 Tax=Jaapia argillacea MUCL 33604 TaxID=933084 RepID=A0A067Q3Y2_9AGAM|nr:hypothetical protein JAAARDRAFT_150588 [Jaapia argillacea MUCL 33604]
MSLWQVPRCTVAITPKSTSSSRNTHRAISVLRPLALHTPRSRCLSTPASQTEATSTINPSEIAFFSKLSSQWWDEQGEFSFLHRMNPVRMQFIREKLLEVKRDGEYEKDGFRFDRGGQDEGDHVKVMQGLDVLDVGCGGGLLSESLARSGAHTLGIDASSSNVAIASLHASADPQLSPDTFPSSSTRPTSRAGSLTYRHAAAEDLLQEPKRYDAVCSMEVLEHVDNPAGFLETCAELVKPGGHLFLSTIARTPLSYFLTIFMAEQVLQKVTSGTHTHAKYVNPSELISFFQKYRKPSVAGESGRPWISRTYEHGLPTRTEAEVRGMVYVPWRGEWVLAPRGGSLLAPSAQCNYLFWVRKPL